MRPTLDDSDLRMLEEGFSTEASNEEKKLAHEVLSKLGYEKIRARPSAKRKRGPKPEQSTNPTEETLRTRVEFLRMILGEQGKALTSLGVLNVALNLLKKHRAQCSSAIFLTDREQAMLHRHCREAERVSESLADYDRSPDGWPAHETWEPLTLDDTLDIVNEFVGHAKQSKKVKWSDLVSHALETDLSSRTEKEVFGICRFI